MAIPRKTANGRSSVKKATTLLRTMAAAALEQFPYFEVNPQHWPPQALVTVGKECRAAGWIVTESKPRDGASGVDDFAAIAPKPVPAFIVH